MIFEATHFEEAAQEFAGVSHPARCLKVLVVSRSLPDDEDCGGPSSIWVHVVGAAGYAAVGG